MKKIVITGATSIMGMGLIQYLLDKDVEILTILRRNSSKNVFIPKNPKIKKMECNLDELHSINVLEKYNVFIHLAWDCKSIEERNDVDKQYRNVKYTLDAVKLAKKLGCEKFIGIGSQAEYGRVEGKISPKTPTNPENAYGIAKLSSGIFSRILANQLEIEHIWTRVFSIYGPYDRKETMIISSINSMLNGNSPEYTKAEQKWDYLYSEDVARALCLIAEKGKNNSIYCIGSGYQRPLREYIEEIKNQINPNLKLKIGAKEYSPNQVMNLCADISDLTRDTGFVPEISFEEGIKRTIKWYKEGNFEKN